VEYSLLTARTFDEETVVTMLVGLTDLLRSKLEVGVGFYTEHLQKPFLEPMMTAASFSAVLTDITHSRVGPWDLCLSLH
jgi:hypothetical protein